MEQESFYNEQQKKQELYEHDADFSHIIASRLNQLIDNKVLTVQDVERASHEELDEFLYRFNLDTIIRGNFYDKHNDKIQRFFRGKARESVKNQESGPIKEQYIAMMKEILRVVQMSSPDICWVPVDVNGMLVYGSRMGDYADNKSDCDFKFIVKNTPVPFGFVLSNIEVSRISKSISDKYDFPNDGSTLREKFEENLPLMV